MKGLEHLRELRKNNIIKSMINLENLAIALMYQKLENEKDNELKKIMAKAINEINRKRYDESFDVEYTLRDFLILEAKEEAYKFILPYMKKYNMKLLKQKRNEICSKPILGVNKESSEPTIEEIKKRKIILIDETKTITYYALREYLEEANRIINTIKGRMDNLFYNALNNVEIYREKYL